MKHLEGIAQWARELRVVARGLIREPRFAALVTVTLALAIGMNAAIFGIADRLLLRGPDHVQDPRNVVRLYETMKPLALGAPASHVISLVLRGSVGAAAIGVALGLVMSQIGGRWIEPLLFNVSYRDPVILGGVAAVLIGVAALAGLLSAVRASRVDPIRALRAE